jgi:hypothetical protein
MMLASWLLLLLLLLLLVLVLVLLLLLLVLLLLRLLLLLLLVCWCFWLWGENEVIMRDIWMKVCCWKIVLPKSFAWFLKELA